MAVQEAYSPMRLRGRSLLALAFSFLASPALALKCRGTPENVEACLRHADRHHKEWNCVMFSPNHVSCKHRPEFKFSLEPPPTSRPPAAFDTKPE
jgi:hypothetical protein